MKKYLILLLFLMILHVPASTCTVAIISGKHTPDGRPILWKHRDTGTLDNKVVFFNGGPYQAVGLVNSAEEGLEDGDPEKAWIGFNEEGFAIMNSASYNLIEEDTVQMPHLEGAVMRDALANCATVDEFEQYLKDLPKPMGLETNFGVIDAEGNAAFFETDHFSHTRIDVDDKSVAPHGYIVRSNYSFTGQAGEGAGYIRFETAERLFYRASAADELSIPHLMENIATSVWNSYSEQDARNAIHMSETESKYMYFHDCINRYSSSSSVAIQGVKEGESPDLTTMWSLLGFPLGSVALPVWITPEQTLPSIMTAPDKENAPLCDWSLTLKEEMIPSRRGSTQYYIDAVKVFNADHTGITQRLIPVSREVIRETRELMEDWQQPPQEAVNAHYDWIDRYITNTYQELFDIP